MASLYKNQLTYINNLTWKILWSVAGNKHISQWIYKSQHSFVNIMHTQKFQLITKPIEQISFGEFTSPSGSQEITRILSNPSLHRRDHWSRPLAVSPTRWIQATTFYHISSRFILILSSHQRLGIQCRLFSSGFPTKIFCTFLFSSKHNTCPTLLYHLYSITWVIFSEEFKKCKSSRYNFLQSLFTSSSSENLISNTFSTQKGPVSKNIGLLKEYVCHLQIKWKLYSYQ
jgi:hypothetical protein